MNLAVALPRDSRMWREFNTRADTAIVGEVLIAMKFAGQLVVFAFVGSMLAACA